MARLELPRTEKHNRWNRDLPPRAHAADGDVIVFHTTSADDDQIDPERPTFAGYDRTRVHPLTGPVYVRDAEPGDVLEVEVLAVEPGEWGWQMLTKHLAYLRDFVEKETIIISRIDRARGVARYPSGAEVPLAPMPGIIGVAPAAHGEFRTIPPGRHAGNIDVREVRPGVSLRIPVFVPGALLSVGDVHAAQGDGEVCLNGIETRGRVETRVHVRKRQSQDRPHLKTPTHYGLLGTGTTVDEACRDALSAAVVWLATAAGISREEAYALCSATADLRINQLVNGDALGTRLMIPRSLLESLGVEV